MAFCLGRYSFGCVRVELEVVGVVTVAFHVPLCEGSFWRHQYHYTHSLLALCSQWEHGSWTSNSFTVYIYIYRQTMLQTAMPRGRGMPKYQWSFNMLWSFISVTCFNTYAYIIYVINLDAKDWNVCNTEWENNVVKREFENKLKWLL